MSGDTLKIFLAMAAYMLVVIGIGVFFAKRAQANSENYFLGGRSLGPWVAAMSAEASDMSGWLLMGGILERYLRCNVDCGGAGSGYLCKLADCGKAAAALFCYFRGRDYDTGFPE